MRTPSVSVETTAPPARSSAMGASDAVAEAVPESRRAVSRDQFGRRIWNCDAMERRPSETIWSINRNKIFDKTTDEVGLN